MAGANFNGLQKIYGEDVFKKIKGCKFHYKESINKKSEATRRERRRFH